MPKGAEKKKGSDKAEREAKPLTKSQKEEVKEKVKKGSGAKVVELVRKSTRLKMQISIVAFDKIAILDGPHYTLFDQPKGAPTKGARGCRHAVVTLGPLAGWPELQPGTDAEAAYPDALDDVKEQIDNATYAWKSGHVINADFGGDGKSNDNMTCLTTSANNTQKGFDNKVKDARSSLHKAYSALRLAGQQSDYFKQLGYGIKVEATVDEKTWGEDYPRNCVSTGLTLEASIVGEPDEEDVRTAMAGSKASDIRQVLGYIESVRRDVQAANGCKRVDNLP